MFKNINLKWKISIISTIIIFIVMGFVAYMTYNYTQEMMADQINEKINLIKQDQRESVITQIERLQQRTEYFAANTDIYNFVNMSKYYITEEGELKSLEDAGWLSTIKDRNGLLRENNGMFAAVKFAYITNTEGLVLADSRGENEESIKQYVGRHIPPERYKDVSTEEVYLIDGQPRVLFNSPVVDADSEETIGYYVMATNLDIFYSEAAQTMDNIDSISLINDKGIILSHTDQSRLGSEIEDKWVLSQVDEQTESATRTGDNTHQILEQISESHGIYMTIDIPLEVINGPVNRVRNIILWIALAGIIILFVSNYSLLTWQLNPLHKIIAVFGELGQGNLSQDILLENTEDRNDEVGQLSQAFNNMVNQFRDIITNINQASEEVEESSNYLKEVSTEVGDVSSQVAESIQDVASGADDQAESVDNINQRIKNLAEDIDNLNQSNRNVKNLADEMEAAASEGQTEINKVSDQMQNIRTAIEEVASGIGNLESISDEIDEILEIINNIAKQTNLLALNAAIEAARAGQAGQGFSVVADEIRNLAEESVDSAGQIGDLIEEVKEETNNASDKMDEGIKEVRNGEEVVTTAEDSFATIQDKIKQVAQGIDSAIEIVNDVDRYSEAIVGNVDEIASISEETSANTQQVAAASQQQNASIEEITSLADKLADMASDLNQLVNQFELKEGQNKTT